MRMNKAPRGGHTTTDHDPSKPRDLPPKAPRNMSSKNMRWPTNTLVLRNWTLIDDIENELKYFKYEYRPDCSENIAANVLDKDKRLARIKRLIDDHLMLNGAIPAETYHEEIL